MKTESLWVIWLGVAAAALVIEAFTLQFVLLYVGLGALVAAVSGALVPPAGQLGVFAVTAIGLLVTTRHQVLRWAGRQPTIETNVDSIAGKMGIVTLAIDNDASTGQIRLGTEFWTARLESDDDAAIPVGERVDVVAVTGVTARVRVRSEAQTSKGDVQ